MQLHPSYNRGSALIRKLFDRRIRPLFDKRYKPRDLRRARFIINVCNYCNLHCFSCSNLMDRQMGENIYRNHPRETTEKHLDLFLTRIENWRKTAWLRFTGGEPTAIEPNQLEALIKTAKNHNRKIDIITNGYQIHKLDPHLFNHIILDDHGINQNLIDRALKHFEEHKYTNYEILSFHYHRDLEHQRRNNISYGPRCGDWMQTITLWQDLIYPCCVMHSIEGFDNERRIGESLREAGWTISNENLLSNLQNWRETIPNEVIRACVLGCWHGGTNIKWIRIK